MTYDPLITKRAKKTVPVVRRCKGCIQTHIIIGK